MHKLFLHYLYSCKFDNKRLMLQYLATLTANKFLLEFAYFCRVKKFAFMTNRQVNDQLRVLKFFVMAAMPPCSITMQSARAAISCPVICKKVPVALCLKAFLPIRALEIITLRMINLRCIYLWMFTMKVSGYSRLVLTSKRLYINLMI